MDCNTEEAKKAMELAEIKFKANDVEGAKRIAKNACDMFGDLPGIRHAVAAYEVHLAAAKNNWHAVLGLLPGDDDDLRKARQQFLKMSILTHPDKNPSAAADGAFKFVMEAWNRLSKAAHGKSSSSNNNAKDDDNNNNAESGCKKQRQKEEANMSSNRPRYYVCPRPRYYVCPSCVEHSVDGRCNFETCPVIWYLRRVADMKIDDMLM